VLPNALPDTPNPWAAHLSNLLILLENSTICGAFDLCN
jgi:hypothetical protein